MVTTFEVPVWAAGEKITRDDVFRAVGTFPHARGGIRPIRWAIVGETVDNFGFRAPVARVTAHFGARAGRNFTR